MGGFPPPNTEEQATIDDSSPLETSQADPVMLALLRRGKRAQTSIVLDDDSSALLVERIIRDFNDGAAAVSVWYTNQIELVKNWEGIVDPKSFPYEDAANVRVPFTSAMVQQTVARMVKALLGGDLVTRFERLDEEVDEAALNDMNQWFQWELSEVVDIYHVIERIISQAVIRGISLPVPRWCKERRALYEYREFQFDPARSIQDQLQTAIGMLFEDKDFNIAGTPGVGIFKVSVKDPDEPLPDPAKVTFSVRNNRLCAQVEKKETVFCGVKIDAPNNEDLVLINTNPDLEKLPFCGLRIWLDIASYREGMANGEWYDLGEERNRKILMMATSKTPEVVPMDYTELQDAEEGTTSTDPQAVDYERRFIEVYRWEGWIHPSVDPDADIQERALAPAVQVAVWCVPRAREIIRIERLEALNKDGKRSPIKFGFIERDNRFFDIGLPEWLRHVQAELDAHHNLRLDSATLIVMPFGFYKPLAGLQKDVFDIRPGKMFPTADPSSVNFPRTNSNPQWSYQDEALVKNYGSEQAGLGPTATGGFISKRQSASEYLGSANAMDLRTELIVNGFLRSFRRLLYRILGLYQQFAPPTRIFQVGGEDGLKLVKRFETDRLNGKLLLRLTGNLDQINPQLQRDMTVNMLQLILNPILIQLGIVKPDTIFAAIQAVAKATHYNMVPLHRPDMPEQSPSPEVENRMMFAGQEVQPHLDEPFDMHLKSHMAYLTDPNTAKTQKSIMLVMQHIQATQKMMQVAQALRMMESAQALQMQKSMASMGIRPGQEGGQQPGDQAEQGTPDEGANKAAA